MRYKLDAKVFCSIEDSAGIISAFSIVDEVIYDSVCTDELEETHFSIFALGEDYVGELFNLMAGWVNNLGNSVVRLKRTPRVCLNS